MLSRKKVARLRLLALVVVLALIVAIFFACSAIANNGQLKYMNMPTDLLKIQAPYRTSTIDAADPVNFTDTDPLAGDSEFTKVAENKNLILYTHNGYKGIKLYDKRTQQMWCSYVEDDALLSNATGNILTRMTSFFTFRYMELHTNITATNDIFSGSCNYAPATRVPEEDEEEPPQYCSSERIKGGVRWTFDMADLSIKISFNIMLDDDALIVEVPDDGVIERHDKLDEISKSKEVMNSVVSSIRSDLDGVLSATDSSGLSDSIKKAVKSSLQDAIKNLSSVKDKTGTKKFSTFEIDQMMEAVQRVIDKKRLDSMPEQVEILKGVVEKMKQVAEAATELSKGIPHGLIDLEVMPSFGAQTKTADGYVFYPDGSGAISHFNVQHPSKAGQFLGAVYGDYGSMVTVGNSSNTDTAVRSVEMPVYGMKVGNSAFLAVITRADTDSMVSYMPITDVQPVASAYGTYLMRKSTTMVNSAGGHTILYDTERTYQDMETRYTFLADENADYSGMARSYRKYLQDTGKLEKSSLTQANTMPLGLEFFMGTNSKQQTLFTSYITMTRFNDVMEMVQKLEKDGLSNLLVSLYGWQQDYNLSAMPDLDPASQLGGSSDLKELASYMTSKGYLLSLDKSMTWVEESQTTSAQRAIASIKAKSQMIRNWAYEGFNLFPMNPVYVYNTFKMRDVQVLQELGVNAAFLYEIDALHYDYNEYAPVDRSDTAQIFAGIMDEVQNKLGYAVMQQVPQYMMSNVDWTTYVAEDDSNYMYSDADVPFYQIVMHGSVVYTGDGFNYMYNTSQQDLKYIEYGYIPFFILTEEEPYELRLSGLKHNFYSTVIDDWYSRIVETYKRYSEDFGDIWNVEIQSHERLSNTVSCTTYANGVKVYVNYALTEQTVNGVTIGAEGYKVVR